MSELSSHHNFLLFSMSFLSYSSSPQHRLCSPYTQLCADWPNPALTGFSKESCPNQGLPGLSVHRELPAFCTAWAQSLPWEVNFCLWSLGSGQELGPSAITVWD